MTLTFRQIGCLWERYWDRVMWNLKQQAKLNGLGLVGESSTESDNASKIDATTDDGLMEMKSRGLPVKFIPTQ